MHGRPIGRIVGQQRSRQGSGLHAQIELIIQCRLIDKWKELDMWPPIELVSLWGLLAMLSSTRQEGFLCHAQLMKMIAASGSPPGFASTLDGG